MRLLSLSEASIQPRTSRLKLPIFEKFWCMHNHPGSLELRFGNGCRPGVALRTCCSAALCRPWRGGRANVGKGWQMLAKFGRLVLRCIDVSDSETRRIFQDFHQSTRFAFFCPVSNSNFSKNSWFCWNFQFLQNPRKFAEILQNLANVGEILGLERCKRA